MNGKMLLLAMALAGCTPESPEVSEQPHEDSPEVSVEANFRKYSPNFLGSMTVDAFPDQRLSPCETDKDVMNRAGEVLRSVFDDPKIDTVRVATVDLSGQPVRIVETVYHWFPGDPGARSSAITWDLFSSDCRVTNGGWEQLN